MLEISYDFLSLNMWVASILACAVDYTFSLSGFEYISYKSWITIELSNLLPYIFGFYIFIVWNVAIVQNIYCKKGMFQWQ